MCNSTGSFRIKGHNCFFSQSFIFLSHHGGTDTKRTSIQCYCYGSSHNYVPRVLVPLIQTENTLEVFRYIPMISAPQHSPTPEHHSHSEIRSPHYTMSLVTLNCRSRGPAPYIGPQTISRTFLIIPESSGTLYRRPFLDRSRQHENSREATRHFRNVPNCAVYRNYVITERRNLNTLRIILRDAWET